jgi:hypothetical protein
METAKCVDVSFVNKSNFFANIQFIGFPRVEQELILRYQVVPRAKVNLINLNTVQTRYPFIYLTC